MVCHITGNILVTNRFRSEKQRKMCVEHLQRPKLAPGRTWRGCTTFAHVHIHWQAQKDVLHDGAPDVFLIFCAIFFGHGRMHGDKQKTKTKVTIALLQAAIKNFVLDLGSSLFSQ